MTDCIGASREQLIRPTRRQLPLEARACPDQVVCGPLPDVHQPESATGPPSSGGHLVGPAPMARLREEENEMHPEDLMKPDLLSAVVLLGCGGVIFVSLLLIVLTALTRA